MASSENRTTMRAGIVRQAVLFIAVVALLAPAVAEDAARFVRPSVEELAIPPQKPLEAAGVSDTREAMCLMIESAARSQDLPLEFFARVIWQESRFQSDAVGPDRKSTRLNSSH